MCYRASDYGDIDERLKYELSGAEYKRAKALMDNDKGTAGAAALRYAIFPGGSDVSTVMGVLKTTPPAEAARSSRGVRQRPRLLPQTRVEGRRPRTRAGPALRVTRRTFTPSSLNMQWPTRAARGSRPSTRRFARTSRQRRRKRPRPGNVGWKTDRLEAEIKNRIADVEAEYNKGEAQKGKDPKSLRDDINKNFSGRERDLAVALRQ